MSPLIMLLLALAIFLLNLQNRKAVKRIKVLEEELLHMQKSFIEHLDNSTRVAKAVRHLIDISERRDEELTSVPSNPVQYKVRNSDETS